MRQGFFKASELISKTHIPTIPQCGLCGLYKTCKSPKMPVTGNGKRKILIVGEAPGEFEDLRNKQFVGKTGQHLEKALLKHGIHMRNDCWNTNALICRPPNNKIIDENKKIAYCRPNVMKTIEELNPEIIILAGHVAVKSVLGVLWKEDIGLMKRWLGWRIPCSKPNAWICPINHPSALLRGVGTDNEVMDLFWHQQIDAISELEGRPWRVVPDYKSQVEYILDSDKAAKIIYKMIDKGGVAAIDYETDRLKPDSKDKRIVCCSICWEGKKTIAYPWRGKAVRATRAFLQSPRIAKIASNLKFENRWTIAQFGTDVRNWLWDTMLGAHVLDNRAKITSIKFQAFVHLGAEVYDNHIKKFLKAKMGEHANQIENVDITQLLIYCGLDSLLEYLVAKIQIKSMHPEMYKEYFQ